MGLDNFWVMPETKPNHPPFDPPLNLCGGIFSNTGQRSFRGKVYSQLISEICGRSLYQECLENKDIQEIANKLEQTSWENLSQKNLEYPPSKEEFDDLKRMFKTYGETGGELHSWW